jgi:outer membrane protein TolC
VLAVLGTTGLGARAAGGQAVGPPDSARAEDRATALSRAIGDPVLRSLTLEALERSPRLAALAARAQAEAWHAGSVGGLPDLDARLTAYVDPPETRVGPQRAMASVMQELPWSGKRGLEREVAEHRARAAEAELAAARLALVTEVRTVYYELAFVEAQTGVTEDFRAHLLRHEEIARARYTTGRGGTQDAIKLQAEITRVDQELLDLETRRASLGARLNGLLDRRIGDPAPAARLDEVRPPDLDREELLRKAIDRNPRIESAQAMIAGAESEVGRMERSFKPDFMVGLTYAWVDRRDDAAGRANPPPDDGQDVFGVQGGIRIPIWRGQRRAGLEESLERRNAQERLRAQVVTAISAELADQTARIELTWRELRLLEDLLLLQAEEAVESAQSAYIAGTLNALDLFDAEHLLFDTRTAMARASADLLIAVAELEGVVAGELGGRSGS